MQRISEFTHARTHITLFYKIKWMVCSPKKSHTQTWCWISEHIKKCITTTTEHMFPLNCWVFAKSIKFHAAFDTSKVINMADLFLCLRFGFSRIEFSHFLLSSTMENGICQTIIFTALVTIKKCISNWRVNYISFSMFIAFWCVRLT